MCEHFRTHRTTLEYYCRRESIKADLASFNSADESNWKPLDQIYLGAEIHQLLQTADYGTNAAMIADVRSRCRLFMVKLCEEIKKRFDMSDPVLHMISFLIQIAY